ncbi:MAG: hypothetical protein Q7U89_04235 [Coriobacteriia bacterium]|nr:hypothetical protein [Coriobacteriia bacterium]
MPEKREFTDASYSNEREREKLSLGTLGTILVILILVVVVLLFWRACGTDEQSSTTQEGGGTITSVGDLDRIDAGVAVWLKPGTGIETVLERNGLAGATYTDFGEGTFVIDVGKESAERTVSKLKGDEGLYDAGFIYADTGK